jgi:hypothetical protein
VYRRARISVAGLLAVAGAVGLAVAGCVSPQRPLPAASSSSGLRFDPLVRPATIGWLPEDTTHYLTRISGSSYEVIYKHGKPPPNGGPVLSEIGVQVWPAGLAPWQTGAGDPVGYFDTDPINGRAAQWLAVSDPRAGLLRWEYRPDSWALVRISSATDPHQTAQLIAKDMRFEAIERVRLPWRFTGLPAEVTVGGLQVIEDEHTDTPWQAEVFSGSGCKT